MKRALIIGLALGILVINQTIVKGEETMISAGKKVRFDYVLTVDGETVDTSESKGPLEYTQGEGQIIPGLEKQMEGLKVGENKVITVPSMEAYGDVNPDAFREIPKEQLPQDMKLEVGQVLTMKAPDGKVFPVMVSEVKENSVVLNLNHPLAGKELQFDVTVVEIQ